jgi:PilZ domain-containing protein
MPKLPTRLAPRIKPGMRAPHLNCANSLWFGPNHGKGCANFGFAGLRESVIIGAPSMPNKFGAWIRGCDKTATRTSTAEKRMSEEGLSEDHSQEERRHFDRSRLLVDVSFDGGDATGIASSKDISLGGPYMNTQTEIPIGETLALRIPLGGQHVVIKADVVYSNPGHGVGVRFHRLSDEAREIMERELPAP